MASSKVEKVRDPEAKEARRKEKQEKKLREVQKDDASGEVNDEPKQEKTKKVKTKTEKVGSEEINDVVAKEKKTSTVSDSENEAELHDSTTSPISKKRKRDDPIDEEIEIDLSLPAPLSKKALRKEKKAKSTLLKDAEADNLNETGAVKSTTTTEASQRSDWGIWVGNLPWSATKAGLRVFFQNNANLTEDQITRIHMPKPRQDQTSKRVQAQNRGFAYVDFSTQDAMYAAMGMNEQEFFGRNVLIKNAKSFEGRPDKPKSEEQKEIASGKPPSQRVFVGNLGFDVTRDDLTEHFNKCGEVKDIFMATFEDSGKSKGYAWVTFTAIEAARNAVQGWVLQEPREDSDDEDAKTKKPRKVFVNKLHGRDLRCEFAEDSTTRYNKRYGKEKPKRDNEQAGQDWLEEVPSGNPRGRRDRDGTSTTTQISNSKFAAGQGKRIVFD